MGGSCYTEERLEVATNRRSGYMEDLLLGGATARRNCYAEERRRGEAISDEPQHGRTDARRNSYGGAATRRGVWKSCYQGGLIG